MWHGTRFSVLLCMSLSIWWKSFCFFCFFSLSLSKDCHCNVVGKTGWRCFLVVDVEPGSNVKTLLSGVVVEVFSRTSGTDVVLQDKYALKVSFQSGQEVHRDTWCGGKHICKPGIAEPMIAVCFPFCCLYRGSHRLLYIWASGWSKELYWHNSSVNTNSHTPFFYFSFVVTINHLQHLSCQRTWARLLRKVLLATLTVFCVITTLGTQ